jgi:hypothetical protein
MKWVSKLNIYCLFCCCGGMSKGYYPNGLRKPWVLQDAYNAVQSVENYVKGFPTKVTFPNARMALGFGKSAVLKCLEHLNDKSYVTLIRGMIDRLDDAMDTYEISVEDIDVSNVMVLVRIMQDLVCVVASDLKFNIVKTISSDCVPALIKRFDKMVKKTFI